MKDLGTLPPEEPEDNTTEAAYGINNRGEIVGSSGSFGPIFMSGLQFARGVIIDNQGQRQWTKNNASFIPYAVNDAGEIVGLNGCRGFFYANGKLIALGTLSKVPEGNRSLARGINQQGQVVGWSTAPGKTNSGALSTHAFLWQRGANAGRMRDLGTLPGCISSYAYGINRRGRSDRLGRRSNRPHLWRFFRQPCESLSLAQRQNDEPGNTARRQKLRGVRHQ